jgi:hypothetical protein
LVHHSFSGDSNEACMCHCLRANTSLHRQPGLLLDQPRGADGVFDLPPALVILDPGLGQIVEVAAEPKGRARTLEGLHSRASPGALVAGLRALAHILAHHAQDGQAAADGPLADGLVLHAPALRPGQAVEAGLVDVRIGVGHGHSAGLVLGGGARLDLDRPQGERLAERRVDVGESATAERGSSPLACSSACSSIGGSTAGAGWAGGWATGWALMLRGRGRIGLGSGVVMVVLLLN